MKTHNLQGHLLQQFLQYSISELIELNNDLVKGTGWGRDRSAFRTAVISALRRKGVDLSPIISRDDGFTTIHMVPIKLSGDNNIIIAG
ncbi:5-oxoprolinase [Sphingobacterium corticibacterium]|uniref:5-oxoprolinase n=1 Tax=Sphingobacterium corticibacterium TaxID=2484746 RepID=A0A4Q6XFT4_9SPHI|nr:5-oxoprolinase [Sphingobacterium corticibacterium]RZF58323.1 5-oxoprolinase [Sphingobacterium corticibacterium]